MPEEKYMRRAIELAKLGSGHVNPNPLVGAVIVRDGEILGEGYHECYGKLHAERNAIAHAREAGNDLSGATIYVTLEPCCHYGKTPPCTEALIENKIATVVVGSDDPNPLVAGKGFEILRAHGIEVIPHFLKEECDAINDIFFHYISHKTPYVAMKYAMTLDGKIACYTGDSKWVTGEEARTHVQTLRNHYMGIMAGIGTVLSDDPMLNCRIPGGRNPIRIICDDHLRIPMECQIVRTASVYPVIVACLKEQDQEKKSQLINAGVKVMEIPAGEDGRIDLGILMEKLGEEKIDGILLEGGGILNESALSAGIVKKVYTYIAPKMFGGKNAKSPVEGQGCSLAAEAWQFEPVEIQRIGKDVLVISKIKE